MSNTGYHFADLNDIASFFRALDKRATDQAAKVTTKREQMLLKREGVIWGQAADIITKSVIETQ